MKVIELRASGIKPGEIARRLGLSRNLIECWPERTFGPQKLADLPILLMDRTRKRCSERLNGNNQKLFVKLLRVGFGELHKYRQVLSSGGLCRGTNREERECVPSSLSLAYDELTKPIQGAECSPTFPSLEI